jgi:hypothetical protein
MKKILIFSFVSLLAFPVNGQSKKSKDREAIKKMCGCFEVTFNFAETFNYSKDKNYKPSDVKLSKGLEWAELVTDNKDKISIQHLLIVGPKQRQSIVKHWRQDWLYQNTDFYEYDGDNKWKYVSKQKSEVKKQWTQKVFQVDDSPRYEGSGSWVHVDGKSYWENTTTAPLPRREFSKRSDYNVTLRGNRHEITNFGWVHDQDNKKMIRKDNSDDFILAEEKGYNTYVRVPDERCLKAQQWWAENKSEWELVRSKWNTVFAAKKDLQLRKSVDKKPLFRFLFAKDYKFTRDNINETIDSFVK